MNVFIGCSSSDNINKIYIDETIRLAKTIADNNLIVGGVNGLMGILINEFVNSTILCVRGYYDDIGDNYNKKIYDTINDRKNAAIDMADVFVFLPGGIGTIDELFNIIEAKRSGQHNKKIIIYNINHYYDNLISLFDNIYREKFSNINNRNLYLIVDNIDDCISNIGGNGNE